MCHSLSTCRQSAGLLKPIERSGPHMYDIRLYTPECLLAHAALLPLLNVYQVQYVPVRNIKSVALLILMPKRSVLVLTVGAGIVYARGTY